MELAGGGIIRQHLAHVLFRESGQLVEFGGEGVVGADVESAGQVVHRYGAYTGDETPLDGGVGTRLHGVEEAAQIARTVRFALVAVQAGGFGQYLVGEVVVLVDEEEDLLTCFIALLVEVVQLLHGSLLLVHLLLDVFGQILGIYVTEEVEFGVVMRVERLAVAVQLGIHYGEVQVNHEVGVSLLRGMLADVESAVLFFEIRLVAHVIVVVQHGDGETFAEPPWTDVEEVLVGILYHGDKTGFVHVVTIVFADIDKVHHSVGNTLALGPFVHGNQGFDWHKCTNLI